MFREITVIYVQSRVKHIKKLCGKNTQTFNDKAGSMYSIYHPVIYCNILAVE